MRINVETVPMPRKPRLPEPLEIEGLSGEKPKPPGSFVDDFSGELVPMVEHKLSPAQIAAKPSAGELRAKAKVQPKAQPIIDYNPNSGHMELRSNRPKVALVPKGKHIGGELVQKDGSRLAMFLPNPAWRRM